MAIDSNGVMFADWAAGREVFGLILKLGKVIFYE